MSEEINAPALPGSGSGKADAGGVIQGRHLTLFIALIFGLNLVHHLH